MLVCILFENVELSLWSTCPPNPSSLASQNSINRYTWSCLTPLNQVKVFILGSRPHPQAAHCNGLAFSQTKSCPHFCGAIQPFMNFFVLETRN
ncbi:uncharacterized protein VP01_6547g2 [Puccinia sorghi]|uniref:Uncharacterized protein n=1 Tax=Puccinia sorghi TaxID=27349 RepID=A0A0L6UFF7_9BASI|nr:uncharacterized protein VP01_6547g2 [Puccinia sorghi]